MHAGYLIRKVLSLKGVDVLIVAVNLLTELKIDFSPVIWPLVPLERHDLHMPSEGGWCDLSID